MARGRAGLRRLLAPAGRGARGPAAPAGYVVGLHGGWGSGKSTVLDLIRAHLGKWREEARAALAEFSWFDFGPWIVSGHQDLAATYFKVLLERVGDAAERHASAGRLLRGPGGALTFRDGVEFLLRVAGVRSAPFALPETFVLGA